MKPSIRWQLLLAVLGMTLVVALLSYQEKVQSAGTCYVTQPVLGGTYVEGMVGAPRYLNPLLSDANQVDQALVDLLFDGLTRYDVNGRLVPALAESWQVGDDGLSITFQLRPDAVWQDGEPVTAADVAFTYGLMQQEEFPGSAALKGLWQRVTISVVDPLTVQFSLPEPYAPFMEATTRGLLPAHRLAGVTAAELSGHAFNLAPVGTGPFEVPAGQAPAHTGRLRLLPGRQTWPQGTRVDALEFRFFPDERAMLAALDAGEIDAIHAASHEMIPALLEAEGMRLFSAPAGRYMALWFNVRRPPVSETSLRQALAYALDRPRLIDDVPHGQGIPLEGPFLPSSWAYNPALLTRYQWNVETAVERLEAAGWVQAEGQALRAREETPLELDLLYLVEPTQQALAVAIQASWESVGVGVRLQPASDVTALLDGLSGREFDVALLEIRPPLDPDQYDFWSQEAIIKGQNFTAWNDRRASEALEQARQLWVVTDRRPFYNTFLRRFDAALPALTLYQLVETYAIRDRVVNVDIGRIGRSRDRYSGFGSWFLGYEEVAVLCALDESG